MALPHNNTPQIRAVRLKSPLLALGLCALSHGQWYWRPAIDAIVRREGLRHA
jgi:hypothetical protein